MALSVIGTRTGVSGGRSCTFPKSKVKVIEGRIFFFLLYDSFMEKTVVDETPEAHSP